MDKIRDLEIEKLVLEKRIKEINREIRSVRLLVSDQENREYMLRIFQYFFKDRQFSSKFMICERDKTGDGVTMIYDDTAAHVHIYKRTTFRMSTGIESLLSDSEEIKYGTFIHIKVKLNDTIICDKDM